jgi:hypothetical protein
MRPALRQAGGGDLALVGQVHLVAVALEHAHLGQMAHVETP